MVDWCKRQRPKCIPEITAIIYKEKCQYLGFKLISSRKKSWVWVLTSSWLWVLTSFKLLGCLEIVSALCGGCKPTNSSTIFHRVFFFFHDGKREAETLCSCWLYSLDLCKSTSECVWSDCRRGLVYVPVVSCNVIILALQGLNVWKFVSCH